MYSQVAIAADQMYKCNINGTVTFQRDACSSSTPRERPTAAQLNAERQMQLRHAKESPPAAAGQLTQTPNRTDYEATSNEMFTMADMKNVPKVERRPIPCSKLPVLP